ncbi:hypothetical protein [Actinomadura sp. HBU206391]|uniref:hypothetical protein n=1 Tax=Actinomadura sp. HBU206391 TaxID=2731692 RepID=UPI00164F1E2A|nr:hypothetical protein [Actinomadura sp. HBU206391]MBC6461805.1 hypothetical protein [Actinomadura sp. HBU206391]
MAAAVRRLPTGPGLDPRRDHHAHHDPVRRRTRRRFRAHRHLELRGQWWSGGTDRLGCADPQQADELLDASGTDAKAIPNVGDEAYEANINFQPALVVRSGRHIVVFDDVPMPADPFLLDAARTAAKRLKSR